MRPFADLGDIPILCGVVKVYDTMLAFDLVTSRNSVDQLADPYEFLAYAALVA